VKYHAFVDESARGKRYLVTAVMVLTRDLASVTRQVRTVIPSGNRRTHLSAENASRRRAIIKGYATLDVGARVVKVKHLGGDDQVARERCLTALVERLDRWQVGVIVLDSRGPVRDRRDRQCIAQDLRRVGPGDLHYTHRGSSDEPLLCLPDAVGWAVGAGAVWRQLIEPVVDEVIDLDQ
jgi:hypothetical protein